MPLPPESSYTEQSPYTRVFQSDAHLSAESTQAMRTKCLAQGRGTLMRPGCGTLIRPGRGTLMRPGCELLISVSRNRHPAHMTNAHHWQICDSGLRLCP